MVQHSPQRPWQQRPRSRRGLWWLVGAAALVVAAGIVAAVLVLRDDGGVCCAIEPSDDAAIDTARDYVTALSGGSDQANGMLAAGSQAPDEQRSSQLSALADEDTMWFVAGTEREGSNVGDTPAERVVVGLTSGGHWGALLVKTDRDYREGTVDPDVAVDANVPTTVRGGSTPIFGDVEVAGSFGPDALYLARPGAKTPEELPRLEHKDAWVYTGPGLTPGRYLLVWATAASNYPDDELVWQVHADFYTVG